MHSNRFRRSSPAAWLAILAVLIQALLPAVHHPAGMALAGPISFGDLHNFCFAPRTPAPAAPDKAPTHHLPACPLCQAMHAIGAFAPPRAPALPLRTSHTVELAAALTAFGALPPLRIRPQPRAPPLA